MHITGNQRIPAILAASNLPPEVEARLADTFSPVPFAEAPSGYGDGGMPYALLCTVDVKVDANLIASLPPSVRVIGTYSVGLDHIDVAAAKARGIEIVNTPGVLADAVAEIAMLLMIGAARRVRESVHLIESGSWTGWRPDQLLGISLKDRRLGILGMGEIGMATACRARAFGMHIHYLSRSRKEAAEIEGYHYAGDLPGLLCVSDILLIACPSNAETRGLIDKAAIEAMPAGAVVVNIARGDVIDDEALIAALESRRLYAAGLDVFAGEPALHESYRRLPNVFALPHIGSSTMETRLAMADHLAHAVAATLAQR